MMDPEILASISSILEAQAAGIEKNNRVLELILAELKKHDEKEENVIIREIVVPADDIIKSKGIQNHGFTRARVFLDAGFTKAHTAGITVSMLYKNSKMSDIMTLVSSNGSCGKASEPVDISNISGFSFEIRNHDVSNDTTVSNLRVVLYRGV